MQRRAEDGDVLGLVVLAAVILAPRGFGRVLVEVLLGHMVVLADDGAAQAGEVAFRLIGAGAVEAVGEAVVDAERVIGRFHVIPMRALVGVQDGPEGHPLADDLDALGFLTNDEGQRAALALTQDDDHAAVRVPVLGQATVLAVLLLVLRADVAAEVRAVHFDHAGERHVVVPLGHRFAQLVGQDEGRLVLAVQIAGELEGADPLRRVDEDADRRQQVHEGHLARGEDRARGRRELLAAGPALPLAAGRDEVGVAAAAIRAEGFPAGLRKADRRERLKRLVVGHAVDVLELEGPGGGREEEVGGHDTVSDNFISNIVDRTTAHKGLYIVCSRFLWIDDMPEHTDWEAMAANLLKAELKRKGVTYARLVEMLSDIGISEKEVNVANKLSRGKFSAAFMLQCMKAIGTDTLHI